MVHVRIYIQGHGTPKTATLAQVPVAGDYVKGEGGIHEVLHVVYTPGGPGDADIQVAAEAPDKIG